MSTLKNPHQVMDRHGPLQEGVRAGGTGRRTKSWLLLPVMIISLFAFLAASGHLAFVFDLSRRTHFD